MNTNIRKRRAYGHDEPPAEPVFYGATYSPTSLGIYSFPAEHRYILDQAALPYALPQPGSLDLSLPAENLYVLEQAAFILNQPVDALLELSNQQCPYPGNQQHLDLSSQRHFHKRPRLSPTSQMPPPYSDGLSSGQEKVPLGGQPDAGMDAGMDADRKPHGLFPGRSHSSGWTGSRLADCFASFSMCTPFESQPPYQPLLTPTSYDYEGHRPPALDTAVVSVQPQTMTSLVPSPATPDQNAMFPCDGPALMAQYLPNYPPLLPERVMGFQPATAREEMIYPNISVAAKCESNTGSPPGSLSLGIPPPPYLVDLATPISPYGGHGVMDLPARFYPVQGFEVMPGTAQDKAVIPGHYPVQVPKTTQQKRGPFRDQDTREKTAVTRKMGSCIRCRMQRIRCNLDPENEGGPCLSCKKIGSSAKVYRLNCLRVKITDVKLFKPGQVKGQEWTNRWKDSVMDDIGNWDSSQIRTIQVTEGYTGKSVRLQVRQFRPQEGDKIKRSWVARNGNKHEVNIPTFAIVNLDEARAEFNQYIKAGMVACCHHLLGSRDQLLWRTYSLAIKTAQDDSIEETERSLLLATLDLWMSVRLTTKSFEIVGDDTLGMPQNIINDQDNPLHGKIPLPPVMGAQIDSVIIHQIQPLLRRKALDALQKMTQEKKQKTWLTTYLVTFILLHNISLITKHDADYAKKHGMPTRFAREANVKEYNLGANTLLAYFHYCNKATYPFSAECKDQDLQTLAELDDEAISFVHYTRRLIAEHDKEWQDVWENDAYEHEFYYVSQLFEPNWQARTMA